LLLKESKTIFGDVAVIGGFEFLNFLDASSDGVGSIFVTFVFELIEELWRAVEMLFYVSDCFCSSCRDDGDYLPFDPGQFCLLLDGLFDHQIVLIRHVDEYPDCSFFLDQHFDCLLDWVIGGVSLLIGDLLCASLKYDLGFGFPLHLASRFGRY
jgi:hypothetical protein